MSTARVLTVLFFSAAIMLLVSVPADGGAGKLTMKEKLGKCIFFDEDLSINGNQSCATCHASEVGWTGPDSDINAGGSVYEGSIPGRFGDRKPPSSAYATPSPVFGMDKKGLFVGGNFWDGRATGETLGNPAADQAQGPFLNPVEQALPDSACVVYLVCTASYSHLFRRVWGDDACDIQWVEDPEDPNYILATCKTEGATVSLSDAYRAKSNTAYDNIALSIAAYEASSEVNAFSSKYDFTFENSKKKAKLSKEEQKGSALFW
ncbi:MAG: cytochrome c peroxidase, partial [bacterium]|nr:cytochrome c peroxidase [bacterium]